MTWWICGRGTPAARRYADTTLVPSATASDGGAMTVVPLSDAELDGVLAAWDATVSKVASADGYRPVFNETVRTVVYVVALVASVAGLGLMSFGHADVGGFVSTAAGILAGGFGVAYNPLRGN